MRTIQAPQMRRDKVSSVAKIGRVKSLAICAIALRIEVLNWRIETIRPMINKNRIMMSQMRLLALSVEFSELFGGVRLGGVDDGRSGEGDRHSLMIRAQVPMTEIKPANKRRRARQRQVRGKRLRWRFIVYIIARLA